MSYVSKTEWKIQQEQDLGRALGSVFLCEMVQTGIDWRIDSSSYMHRRKHLCLYSGRNGSTDCKTYLGLTEALLLRWV